MAPDLAEGDARMPLPEGHRLTVLDSVDSTNAEALRLAQAGQAGGLWIVAREQTGGRGRAGRPWNSPPGNLYCSLLLRPRCPLSAAPGLSLLAAVAMHEAIERATAGRLAHPALALKWPNDLMLGRGKLGGILLESVGAPDRDGFAIVIGAGVNVAGAPDIPGRDLAWLDRGGPAVDPMRLFAEFAAVMARWLASWDEGRDFASIRCAWIERAGRLGERASVRVNGAVVEGAFLGIDESGALRLGLEAGETRVSAGDLFFPAHV